MKRLLILIPLLFTSGCVMALNQAQMRNKLPRVNTTDAHVELSTIYGVAGEITAKKVTTTTAKNGDKIQTFTGYSDQMTSPLGHIKTSFGKISFRNGVPVDDPEAESNP